MRHLVLPLLLLIELAVFLPLSGVEFDSWQNFKQSAGWYFRDLIVQATPLLILVPGMTIVLATAGIDLSVGSLVALVACVMARFAPEGNYWMTAVPAGLAVAASLGAFNGILIAVLDIPPIIATLGTLFFYRGLCQVVLGSSEMGWFHREPDYAWWGEIQGSLVLISVILVAGGALFARSRWRREVLFIGGNPIAARYAGIPVTRRLIQVYTLMGLLCLPAAVSFTARNGSVTASVLAGFELDVIVAVVLGGTRVSGGFASISGSFFGAMLVAVLREGLRGAGSNAWVTKNLPFDVNHLNYVLLGMLLLLGVWLNTHAPTRSRSVKSA
jgi:ribose/xylose/arabinose/galactoside ABC-type transport system permease subunit